MPTGVHSWGSKRVRSRLSVCVCQSLGDCVTPRRRSRCMVGRESTTAQRGIGTFRIPPLSSELRRFVYLVRSGAGRRAELLRVTMGIALIIVVKTSEKKMKTLKKVKK